MANSRYTRYKDTLGNFNLNPRRSDAKYERDVEAMDLFIDEIMERVCVMRLYRTFGRDSRDTASKQRDLHEKLLKLPPRFTFRSVYINDNGDGKFNLNLLLNLKECSISAYFFYSLPQVESLLEIFIACGCSARAVRCNGQFPQSTVTLLKRLEEKHAEKPSLQEIALASIRSALPLPLTDEVLRNTGLPPRLCKELILEDLLNDVMRHMENMENMK